MLQTLDWVIIVGYFAIILGIAWRVIRQKQDTSTEYFLAGRHLGWFIVGASIFASNIGSEHLVGLAGSGATDGVAMAHYELHAWCLLVLAWVMVPFYMRSKVFTTPAFLERRYSPAARTILSAISLIAYVLTKIAVGIYAGGKGLYDYLQGVQSYLAPPIFVVFFTGVLWKRMNAKGCISVLIVGFALGLFRMAVDTPVKLFQVQYPTGSFLWIVNHIYFQYYSLGITILTVLVMVLVSYLSREPDYKHLAGLTFGTTTEDHRRESRAQRSRGDIIASVILVICIVLAYIYFSG